MAENKKAREHYVSAGFNIKKLIKSGAAGIRPIQQSFSNQYFVNP